MSYQISYEYTNPKYQSTGLRWGRIVGYSSALCALTLAAAACLVPQARAVLFGWLFPGDPAFAAAAVEAMLLELRTGTQLPDALHTFCREILDHAEIVLTAA